MGKGVGERLGSRMGYWRRVLVKGLVLRWDRLLVKGLGHWGMVLVKGFRLG